MGGGQWIQFTGKELLDPTHKHIILKCSNFTVQSGPLQPGNKPQLIE